MIACDSQEEFMEVEVKKQFTRFQAWEGRDSWHKDVSVQVRLDGDRVFLSVIRKGTPPLRGYVSLEKLGDALADLLDKHGRKP